MGRNHGIMEAWKDEEGGRARAFLFKSGTSLSTSSVADEAIANEHPSTGNGGCWLARRRHKPHEARAHSFSLLLRRCARAKSTCDEMMSVLSTLVKKHTSTSSTETHSGFNFYYLRSNCLQGDHHTSKRIKLKSKHSGEEGRWEVTHGTSSVVFIHRCRMKTRRCQCHLSQNSV
ncbi:hypothetical protein BV898_00021 [Hypsibius exemplaris]|uniref:Uncharacterized protein n=1 Tax=Hypsibius exemplaris TaxID=2072580 RepID=A0A1W0XET0_HYPEX|nr:hypothetical protein BV898_00021 [Hypsibius exemplaris]